MKGEIMFKVMWLMKRKVGTSMEDLIRHYENVHCELGTNLWTEKGFRPVKYIRRYLHPLAGLVPSERGEAARASHDVAMEMWFRSKRDFEVFLGFFESDEIMSIFIEDELKFLDRERTEIFMLEEHETRFD
ncbi:EthD domain-containing protein [Rhizorhabdus argentea]|uniref:EthD domain-containing protein n=1 Tax=Rhizorhabdus argentea TaxID=1387174 RepID=UPI0030EB670E